MSWFKCRWFMRQSYRGSFTTFKVRKSDGHISLPDYTLKSTILSLGSGFYHSPFSWIKVKATWFMIQDQNGDLPVNMNLSFQQFKNNAELQHFM